MSATFILTPQPLGARSHRLVQKCRRRSAAPWAPARTSPSMMAKYQPKESSEQPEAQSDIDKILPPPLPTLSTLSNTSGAPASPSTDSNAAPDGFNLEILEEKATPADEQLSAMGAGLSSSQENAAVDFLKGVAEELSYIEWPSTERVLRLTVIIFLTIAIAGVSLYFVDGFLYRISRVLFDGKI